jgi:hypothetical protein
MTTESERTIAALLDAEGYHPSSFGIDRDEAWVKLFHNGRYEVVSALYNVDSTDESVVHELVERAGSRGIGPCPR